ncbi:hypothetical protein A1Q2_01724 [Trichosporon asahii var. asahii CBS 8904]|uniref:Uncharacterized protein n=1 Tax=Trichosporon asahii var. asahii (strain CBS 8904) TaxID=1220162 RepID=K1VIV9_TRIAC|nr:hypothetical protein A1Q2_01724 [Trichosporon asahii var. asahii CBS 8904]
MYLPLLLSLLLPVSLGAAIERDYPMVERRTLNSWLLSAKTGDTLRSSNTVYQIVQPHDAHLAKRQGTGSCPNAQYQQREITHTDPPDWSDKVTIPGSCLECFDSDEECSMDHELSWSVSETISYGMDASLAGDFANDITGNAGFNFGYSWTKGWSGSTASHCKAHAGEGGTSTVRYLQGKAKTRSRLCRSSCINESCEDWVDGEAVFTIQDEHGLVIEDPGCVTYTDRNQCLNDAKPSE